MAGHRQPHFFDQAPFFLEREWESGWMGESDIRAHLEREYRRGEELLR